MTKKTQTYDVDDVDVQAEGDSVEPLVIDPTDWDPRKAGFGTPIAFPDKTKDYPTDGSTPYPPPV